MRIVLIYTACVILLSAWIASLNTEAQPKLEIAKTINRQYTPRNVVYDLTSGDQEYISRVLSRLVLLDKLYGSDPFDTTVVVVIHGKAIPFFSINRYKAHRRLVDRARSLTVGTNIEFRMCSAAAKLVNLEAKDIHGFVSMVPMGDAEIIKLQAEGYAYMQ